MSITSIVLGFFPVFQIFAILLSLFVMFSVNSLVGLILSLFSIYALPLFAFRLHRFIFGTPGANYLLDQDKYVPWWGEYQIQLVLNSFNGFESVLRMIPGVYSFWLRLWGAKIGKGITWTPTVKILDRAYVSIGNYVIFGYGVSLAPHVITPTARGIQLYLAKIIVEDQCFLGALAGLGPGVTLESRSFVPFSKNVYPNSVVKAEG